MVQAAAKSSSLHPGETRTAVNYSLAAAEAHKDDAVELDQALMTNEDGDRRTFTVRLSRSADSGVELSFSANKTNELSVSPKKLTWDTSSTSTKTVTVRGVKDGVRDGTSTVLLQATVEGEAGNTLYLPGRLVLNSDSKPVILDVMPITVARDEARVTFVGTGFDSTIALELQSYYIIMNGTNQEFVFKDPSKDPYSNDFPEDPPPSGSGSGSTGGSGSGSAGSGSGGSIGSGSGGSGGSGSETIGSGSAGSGSGAGAGSGSVGGTLLGRSMSMTPYRILSAVAIGGVLGSFIISASIVFGLGLAGQMGAYGLLIALVVALIIVTLWYTFRHWDELSLEEFQEVQL